MAMTRTTEAPARPLTLTVEQTAVVLGIARSTAYELVRTGDIEGVRLRRRIIVPVAHLADRLGVTPSDVWAVVEANLPVPRLSPIPRQSRAGGRRSSPTSQRCLSLDRPPTRMRDDLSGSLSRGGRVLEFPVGPRR